MYGVNPQYVGRSEKLTIVPLGIINRDYVILITTGEAFEMQLEKINEISPKQLHVFTLLY